LLSISLVDGLKLVAGLDGGKLFDGGKVGSIGIAVGNKTGLLLGIEATVVKENL